MIATKSDTILSLLTLVGLDTEASYPALESLGDARYLRDLKINLGNVLNNNQNLSKKESLLLALSIAVNEKQQPLVDSLTTLAKAEGATDAEIAEILACTSLLSTNNVFYRFRHFVEKDYYNQTQPGIRMSIMMNPVLGKEFFELVSLAVSAVNGCELCVKSHEDSVLKHGASEARVFEAIRLAAVVKGFITLI
ncbi:carboxymuconolactone decarboxylase family protein [Tellurirhabdus rosea]|uniref:carboxymuconolactone decarboxylase family protein n=1 Tax=Tellurirhabdus rosea TaxID=2674997 RepID=UPI0022573F5A|nr:carboxymuconolactone decarboxylase family protein [Tellurirhabdus rosea]